MCMSTWVMCFSTVLSLLTNHDAPNEKWLFSNGWNRILYLYTYNKNNKSALFFRAHTGDGAKENADIWLYYWKKKQCKLLYCIHHTSLIWKYGSMLCCKLGIKACGLNPLYKPGPTKIEQNVNALSMIFSLNILTTDNQDIC